MKKELLSRLGLNEKEIRIYMAVLKHGRITPARLATFTKVNRTTAYHICNTLVSKKFLLADYGGPTLYVVPSKPADLKVMVSKEKESVLRKEKMIEQVIDELKVLSAEKDYPIPKIQFIEEDGIEDHLYSNLERWNTSACQADSAWWGFQDHTFAEQYAKWIEWFWKKSGKNISVKLFSNQSVIEHKLKAKFGEREVRFLSHANFTTTIWIVGEYVIMLETQKHPYYLVEICSKAMAENIKIIFERLWKEKI